MAAEDCLFIVGKGERAAKTADRTFFEGGPRGDGGGVRDGW